MHHEPLDKGLKMSDPNLRPDALREEADAAVAGPGVVATKSQTQGGIIGTVLGAIVGALLGLLIAPLFGDGDMSRMIAIIAFAVAGATAGGTMGGFLRNRKRQERGDADV